MAQLFRRILSPIDFDENSLIALDFASKLAAHHKATLYPRTWCRFLWLLLLPADRFPALSPFWSRKRKRGSNSSDENGFPTRYNTKL